jgi:hypothetical protein
MNYALVDLGNNVLSYSCNDDIEATGDQRIVQTKSKDLPGEIRFCKYNPSSEMLYLDESLLKTTLNMENNALAQRTAAKKSLAEKYNGRTSDDITDNDALAWVKIQMSRDLKINS